MTRPLPPRRLYRYMPLVGTSDQVPDRELTYHLVSLTEDGRLVLRQHHREGYTGTLENFVEYGEYVSAIVNPELLKVPESERPSLGDRLIERLDEVWQTCVVTRRSDPTACRFCREPAPRANPGTGKG